MTFRLVLLAVGIALVQPAAAQTVRLYVPADSVLMGERFAVTVAVERAPGAQVLFPEPPRGPALVDEPLRAGEAELLAVQRFPPTTRGGFRVDSARYEAAVFTLDAARIGPLAVRVVIDGDTMLVPSPVAGIGVRSLVPEDAEGLLGPAPLASFPRSIAPWLWALGAALLVASVIAAWLYRRRRHGPAAGDTVPPQTQARQRLEALEAAPPQTEAELQPYYVELSDALRTYLARTLAVPARELTTAELIAALDRLPEPPPDEARAPLHAALQRADLVKFAGIAPSPEAHIETIRQARRAVAVLEVQREAQEARAAEEARRESER